LTANRIELRLRRIVDEAPPELDTNVSVNKSSGPAIPIAKAIAIPWTSPVAAAAKGIIRVPAYNTPMTPSRRDALLIAIAKARRWMDDLAHARAASFAVIARREAKVERHIRLLVTLAFLSPRIVSGLLDGTAPANFTITALARALPWSWAEQEHCLGLNCDCTSRPIARLAPSHSIQLPLREIGPHQINR
jgi:hypothetical protein